MSDKRRSYYLADKRSLILVALSQGSQHGYGLKKVIEAMTNGERKISLAAIYDNINRLRRDGLVERKGDTLSDEGRNRREYEITAEGRLAIQDQKGLLDSAPAPSI